MTHQDAKLPKTTLLVTYKTLGGRKTIPVQPSGETVTIDGRTYKVSQDRVDHDKKGCATCTIVEGQTEALPIWKAENSEISPEELNAFAKNNLLEQLHNMAGRNKAMALNWIMLAALGLIALVVIGVAVAQNGDLGKIKGQMSDLQAKWDARFPPASTHDTTTGGGPAATGCLIGSPGCQSGTAGGGP